MPVQTFPVRTTSDLQTIEVIGMGAEPKPREKASPEGEVTYTTGAILMVTNAAGEVAPQKSASINVINPAVLVLGEKYLAQGRIYVQPYESNSRVTYSITVERFVPVNGRQAAPAAPKGE